MFFIGIGTRYKEIPIVLQIHFVAKPCIPLVCVISLAFGLLFDVFFRRFVVGKFVLQFLRNVFAAFALRQRLTFRISRFKFGFYAVCLRTTFPCRFSAFTARKVFFRDGDIMIAVKINFAFRSFANSKTLAIIVSKKTRLSSSDNAVMSGVPTVTISSSVFSTFITSSYLIFERRKNTPHYLGSKTAKSKGLSGKFCRSSA